VSVPERSTSYHWAADDPSWAWLEGAACAGAQVDIFFPVKGESYAEARSVCRRCPVLQECRAEIDRVEGRLRGPDAQGFYAGETPAERRRRRADAAATVGVERQARRERTLAAGRFGAVRPRA
jgi:WhiB family redox-sensing transcriptional regulator